MGYEGLFALKLLVGQPSGCIFFLTRMYPANGFFGQDLVLWRVSNGGAILRPTAGYSVRERRRSIPRGRPLQRI
jgi:hypothetical protein